VLLRIVTFLDIVHKASRYFQSKAADRIGSYVEHVLASEYEMLEDGKTIRKSESGHRS
jgi:hypothetical protein